MLRLAFSALISLSAPAPAAGELQGQCLGASVYFEPGSARIGDHGRQLLDALPHHPIRPTLRENRVRLLIYAGTDREGAERSNLVLSRRRGQAVRKYLLSIGFRPQQVTVIAEGEHPRSEGMGTNLPDGELRRALVMIDAPLAIWQRYIPSGTRC